MRIFLLIFFCFLTIKCYSQRDHHWVFGDSAGINFNTNPPSVDTTRVIQTIEPSASISDPNGDILFYVGSANRNQLSNGCKKYIVRTFNDSVMQGGDSLAGHCSITQGLIILPDPGDTNRYYIFHSGVVYDSNGVHGVFCYSIVDMSLNNGLGALISTNVFLEDSISEKLHAVKAGNGTSWWLVATGNFPTSNFYRWLIDSNGIHPVIIQQASLSIYSGIGQMIFSPNGDKLLYAGGGDNSLLFDFDRCTGIISNQQILHTYNFSGNSQLRYGCSFSPSGRYAYISSFDSLWQFDTQAANVAASKQLISAISPPQITFQYGFGQHMLAPDGKIYIASHYNDNIPTIDDSLYTYLTVINYPDSNGVGCQIAPYSFYLGGKKSRAGLPNMPNYNLGPMENVDCDSILAVNENEGLDFIIYPNPGNGKFSLQFKKKPDNVQIDVFTLMGNNIYSGKLQDDEPDLVHLPEGMYMLRLSVDKRFFGSRRIVITR